MIFFLAIIIVTVIAAIFQQAANSRRGAVSVGHDGNRAGNRRRPARGDGRRADAGAHDRAGRRGVSYKDRQAVIVFSFFFADSRRKSVFQSAASAFDD